MYLGLVVGDVVVSTIYRREHDRFEVIQVRDIDPLDALRVKAKIPNALAIYAFDPTVIDPVGVEILLLFDQAQNFSAFIPVSWQLEGDGLQEICVVAGLEGAQFACIHEEFARFELLGKEGAAQSRLQEEWRDHSVAKRCLIGRQKHLHLLQITFPTGIKKTGSGGRHFCRHSDKTTIRSSTVR